MTQNLLALVWDAWRTRKKGADAVADASVPVSPTWLPMPGQFAVLRLNSIVICQIGLNGPSNFPLPTRQMLMGRFDEWVSDRAVTREASGLSMSLSSVAADRRHRVVAESSGGHFRFREMNDERERSLQVLSRPFSQPSAQS